MWFSVDLDFCDCLLQERYAHNIIPYIRSMRLRKVCLQCNTVVNVKRSVSDCGHAFASKKRKARCTAVGEPENAMKCCKASLSEEEVLRIKRETKSAKQVRELLKHMHEQALHRQEQN